MQRLIGWLIDWLKILHSMSILAVLWLYLSENPSVISLPVGSSFWLDAGCMTPPFSGRNLASKLLNHESGSCHVMSDEPPENFEVPQNFLNESLAPCHPKSCQCEFTVFGQHLGNHLLYQVFVQDLKVQLSQIWRAKTFRNKMSTLHPSLSETKGRHWSGRQWPPTPPMPLPSEIRPCLNFSSRATNMFFSNPSLIGERSNCSYEFFR